MPLLVSNENNSNAEMFHISESADGGQVNSGDQNSAASLFDFRVEPEQMSQLSE